MPVPHGIAVRTLVTNGLVVAVYSLVLLHPRWREREWALRTRDWATLALGILAYREMGWFAPTQRDFHLEDAWIVWDRLVLGSWGLKAFVESLGPVIPTLLDLCYLLVYALPVFCVVLLYVSRRERQTSSFLLIYFLGLSLSYVQFPFWPSEPPRTLFPLDYAPMMTPIRGPILALLGAHGIHTSVFPSAHTSGAFAAGFVIWRLFRGNAWVKYGTLIYATLVAVSTFYGRYHYLVDAIAGFAVALVAYPLGAYLLGLRHRRRRG